MKFGGFLIVSTLAGFAALGVVGGSANAKSNQLPINHCGIFYKKNYPGLAVHKAIASTNGLLPNNGGACGFSYNWPSKASAVADALRSCRKQRVAGILETRCKIFDVR